MEKRISTAMEWKMKAEGWMWQKEIIARKKIEGRLNYLTWKQYQKDELHNLSPNEIIKKIIADLLTLKVDDDFVNLNNEYMKLKKQAVNLAKDINKTKWEIQQTLTMGNNDILSKPLQWLVKSAIIEGISDYLDIKTKIVSFWDLVKFCIEYRDRERHMLHFKNVWKGEIKKIKELFDKYWINI